MTIMEMLGQSGILTVLGMGIVFSFLAILIICVTLLGKIVHALKLDKDVTDPAP
ncbi:MAG: OadG family protein, partial [Treponema sp.]|nr:OadG family protein [Treponema sp.]